VDENADQHFLEDDGKLIDDIEDERPIEANNQALVVETEAAQAP
jgi:hypothetical protein